ncbi:phosphate-selective porin OprO/OprP [Methylobacter tundripaludum]|uniref:Phosphate-selective porin OprO/OprP n=1 Tax=Methylobacter tundripaludum TaxID=173365 RepID=A0A2S6H2G7_9GAMM|nr:porin [Methylobacter tundripaludum]PPK71620.1 phosphate-selective porin OprO/OprP [Methylobacter tundripaludum]
MKISKLTLAIATVLGAGVTSGAFAMDLYVDTKTKQIYAEPGRGRELMGSFEKVDNAPSKAEKLDKAEIKAIREDLALKDNAIKALQEHKEESTGPDSVNVKLDKKGLNFETKDKNFKFKLGGRIQADANYSSNDNFVTAGTNNHVEANDGTEFRRARIDFTGTFFKDWNFKTQADFADNGVAMKDLFIQYTGLGFMSATVGQQKQNFSRELLESSNDLMFAERSLMNVLNAPVVDRAIGLNLQSEAKKGYTAALGIYGDTITANKPAAPNKGDEGWAISGRATYAPIEEKTKVVHLGVAGNYRAPNADDKVLDSSGVHYVYETNHMSNLNLIDTRVTGVNNIKMMGLEAAGLYGPVSVGAEYTRTWLDRKNGGTNLELDGWYADAAWTITGESRHYKQGRFYKVDPAKNFSFKNGGLGAWELAARYSDADLNDGAFRGGKMSNVTVALNWYLNSNIRIMGDYTRAFNMTDAAVTTVTGGKPDTNDTFTIRTQLAY